ncbi:hypothetical protein [Natronococcus occultus]|uniref:hypothetical protein n=1 Tax=Natronococcus occultus TaxID=29288 RepID=UPI000A41ADEE|nr:hypothetical protein [Natronococcus occultus]
MERRPRRLAHEDIALHSRDSASGTFDYFTEHINGEMSNIRDEPDRRDPGRRRRQRVRAGPR